MDDVVMQNEIYQATDSINDNSNLVLDEEDSKLTSVNIDDIFSLKPKTKKSLINLASDNDEEYSIGNNKKTLLKLLSAPSNNLNSNLPVIYIPQKKVPDFNQSNHQLYLSNQGSSNTLLNNSDTTKKSLDDSFVLKKLETIKSIDKKLPKDTFKHQNQNNLNNVKIKRKLDEIVNLYKLNNETEESIEEFNHDNPNQRFKIVKNFFKNNNEHQHKEVTNLGCSSHSELLSECVQEKSLISKLDEKEHLLSNDTNRNMRLLQSCFEKKNLNLKRSNNKSMKISNLLSSITKPDLLKSMNDETVRLKKFNLFTSTGANQTQFNELPNVEVNKIVEILPESIHKQPTNIKSPVKQENIENFKYVCMKCGLRTKRSTVLRKHMRSHENLRPFICCWCKISFKTKGNLVKHMKTQAHVNKCLEMGMSENDSKISKFTSKNINKVLLDKQLEIENSFKDSLNNTEHSNTASSSNSMDLFHNGNDVSDLFNFGSDNSFFQTDVNFSISD